MAKTKFIKSEQKFERVPVIDPEERENQVISAAITLAEQQILDGTASSGIITHYLKLASDREKMRLEREKLKYETKMLEAKILAIESQQNASRMYADAIEAMRSYSGKTEN